MGETAAEPRVAYPGLDEAEAARRLSVHGPNRTPVAPRRSAVSRVVAQLRDPMILLLLAAGVLTATLSDAADTIIIAAVVVFNTLTGVIQEGRADRAVAALGELTTPMARVTREGRLSEVPTTEVVPGDLVTITAGDLVPADGDVLVAHDLLVDQSMMTGESESIPVDAGEPVQGGTLVVNGRAELVVTRTGSESGLGRLALLMASAEVRTTPLQRRLAGLSRILVLLVLVVTAVVVALGLLQGRPIAEMAVLGVSLAVAAVPESLPAVVAVALAMGAHRMALRHAVVRRLVAVETLGSVTVIATDKTGTLTEGRMVAERVWVPTTGDLHEARLLRDMVLCNDATVAPDGRLVGDPLETALLELARDRGLDPAVVRAEWPRTEEEPFDHRLRRMRTDHVSPDGDAVTVYKGAPEAILELVDTAPADEAAHVVEELTGLGCRVLAVAERTDAASPLALVGLVAVVDPPRAEAADLVAECQRAGIRVILVTGDHPGTALALAARVGIGTGSNPPDPDVHARVQPEGKVDIVAALQRSGEVVAMLGDGVNDGPALRVADIGVAAGQGGTEVARQAADVVLLDDDFGSVVAAIEEGRRVYANIRSFLLYAVSGGIAEVGVMLIGPLIWIGQPLLASQILWINLMTHGLTGVAFGAEPADPAQMARPPRSPDEPVFTARFSALVGAASSLLVLVALAVGLWAGSGDPIGQRTQVFVVLGLGQLGIALALRSRAGRARVPWLVVAVAAASALMVAAAFVPALQALVGTASLDSSRLAVAAAAAVVPGVVLRLLVNRDRRAQRRGLFGRMVVTKAPDPDEASGETLSS